MEEVSIKKSNKLTLFNPAFIDDYGFNPDEFRVFARIMRRAGSDKGCTESIANMAHSLQMSERIVRRAIRVLIACGAVVRDERKGKTDVLDFQTCDKWKHSKNLPEIREVIDAAYKKAERERKQKAVQPLAETQPLTPCGNATTPLAETQPPPLAETQPKGIPIEGNPMKVITTASTDDPPFSSLAQSEAQNTVDSSEPDERLRFYPFLERSGLPIETMNDLVCLFADIAQDQDRRTLIRDNEWVDMCRKLFDEGMTVYGIRGLYRYCKEIEKKNVITPKVMDWKLSDYKKFLRGKGIAV